ncbi:MAG: hypothetical protein K2W96_09470, partial [Gemmataceae bacterium]|nr:hypothetical protein [Gemmataceae bacterium]
MSDQGTGRDVGGQFAKGNPGGPGRPKGGATGLRMRLVECATPEQVRVVMDALFGLAKDGNLPAIR